jgi:hypothetical protein
MIPDKIFTKVKILFDRRQSVPHGVLGEFGHGEKVELGHDVDHIDRYRLRFPIGHVDQARVVFPERMGIRASDL